MTCNGIHKFYTAYDSYTIEQNEVLMDELFYLGFTIFELIETLMYETYYDKLQPYVGEKDIQCQYIDTDALVRSIISENIIKDLKNIEDFFNLSNLIENQEIFINKIK